MGIERTKLVEELVDYFLSQQITVHRAKSVKGYDPPPAIHNDGFGDMRARVPDVVGVEKEKQRIVFGIVRETRSELDAEDSLTEYNVFLDHKHQAGDQASLLIVLLPPSLIADFTNILTHYIHRDYWHRVISVPSRLLA